MNDLWKKIQPLRVANGWTIDLNNLYDIELTQENIGWFCGSFFYPAVTILRKFVLMHPLNQKVILMEDLLLSSFQCTTIKNSITLSSISF